MSYQHRLWTTRKWCSDLTARRNTSFMTTWLRERPRSGFWIEREDGEVDKTERRRGREVVLFSLSFVFSLFLESDLNILERFEALVFVFHFNINTKYSYSYYWNTITLWEDEKVPIETIFSLSQQSTRNDRRVGQGK